MPKQPEALPEACFDSDPINKTQHNANGRRFFQRKAIQWMKSE